MKAPVLSRTSARRLRETLKRSVERGEIPGAVAAVTQGNATHVLVVGSKAIGGEPMRRTTLFRIASMTKPIIAVAAMILVERAILKLDDPVTTLLPELGQQMVLRDPSGRLDDVTPTNREITLRDLLILCFGLGLAGADLDQRSPIQRAMLELKIGGAAPKPPPDEWMRRLGSLPLMYQPGQKWLYNTGYDVLGVLIARATGGSLESFLRESLLDPLGMINTQFGATLEQLANLATTYRVDPASGVLDVDEAPSLTSSRVAPAFPSGAGGLVSTVDDYLAFARMMLTKGRAGGQTLVSEQTIELMTRDHLTGRQKAGAGLYPDFFRSYGWGFGVSVVTASGDPRGPNGTYGWDGSLGTSWYTSPHDNAIAILLTQRAWEAFAPPSLVVDFWHAVNQALGR